MADGFLNRVKRMFKLISPQYQKLILDYPVQFRPRYGYGKSPHAELFNLIKNQESTYILMLNKILKYREVFYGIQIDNKKVNSTLPVWNNGYLPGLDMMILYTIISEFKPNVYFEVGSGNSTKLVHLAKTDQKLATKLISVDPMPRVEIDQIVDEVIRSPFEDTDFESLFRLGENDILFIDNSHRILPNSDSMVFYLEVLPKLKKGVIVHLHDIYLPYDYPQFMCDRFYSEQYGLAIHLLANPQKYELIFPSYFISNENHLACILDSLWQEKPLNQVEKHGGSFWFRIL